MKFGIYIIAGVALLFAGASTAQPLAVYPPEVKIGHAEDLQRVVVVYTREDGVTRDVTAQAEAALDAPVAVWGEDLIVRPLADGEATLSFSFEGHSVSVPVAVANAAVVPPMSFRNHVLPVMMRAGCNMGACHGSAQGKNGFHLSLFGFDPPNDYLSLSREVRARRINVAAPEESLMLMKPAGEVDHEGGTRLTRGDALYELLRRWIAEGVRDDPEDLAPLTGIEILPKEAVLEGPDETQRFVVMATYADGTDRDVTELSILSTSDEQTLTIDAAGRATSHEKGEVYVMARFGTFAVVSQAIVIPEAMQLTWPEDAAPKNYIDEFIFAKLRKLRIPPAAQADDHTFLRRVYIDILGVLPTIEETRSFQEDTAPDKRAKLVDALLERPEFAELWAMKWAEVLRVATIANVLDPKAMHRYNDWLRHAITTNTPMDQLVRDLLTAEGGNFTNPATNFYVVETNPEVMAENVAQVFMGIQIKCAQCHNHPFERWTMDDYYSFAAFFAQVGQKESSDPREKIIFNRGSGEVKNLKGGAVMAPKFLGGAQPDLQGRDRRAVLAEWLTGTENPWFANNVANRVWAHFLGGGIIDPPDDVRVTNPPTNPLLLDEIGKRLVSYNYDLRRLVRDICTSYTYQMSTQPREPSIRDERNFAFARIRRLTAEQLLDAIAMVTDTKVKFPNLPLGARAAQVANGNSGIYFLDVFGRPTRDTVCTCERRGEPTLAQSLHLINGDTMNNAIRAGDGRLAQRLASETPPSAIVDELYLAAFARTPAPEEKQRIEAYVDAAEDKRAALEDAFWSVLNSKEFIFNH